MAIYDCDYGRHRYPQAQQSIYWTAVTGRSGETYSCRYCPSHFRQLQIEIRELMSQVLEDSKSSDFCNVCNEPRTSVLYAKVFPAKGDLEYWVADLCARCASETGNRLRIFNGRPMGDA